MAADSASSSRIVVASQEASTTRPEAGPLPTKRGEIGYRESLNPPPPEEVETEIDLTTQGISSLPARHPADRELPPPPPPAPRTTPSANASGNQASSGPRPSSGRGFVLFRPRTTKKGVRTSTIFLLVTQGSLLLLTIALWIILATLVLPATNAGRQSATSVFVHITFVTSTIVQVALLERLFFRYRAERYAMLHPGEVLPDLFNRGEQVSTRLAIAPWNRPPLPTYAAVLMESGIGTGDVEDNQIAIVPPPAYGNTRGSTLLMAGFISTEFRQQARLAREARGERSSLATVASAQTNKSDESRPLSYVTVDSEWDARCDMDRAAHLAEALARLEAEERDVTTALAASLSPSQAEFEDSVTPRPSSPQTPSAS